MIKQITKEEYKEVWASWNGSPLQSWQWGEVKSSGAKAERLGFFKESVLKGIVTVFIKPFPFQKAFKLLKAEAFGYIPHGLCVENPDYLQEFLAEIKSHFQDKNLAFLLIDPSENFFDKNWNESFKVALEKSGWVRSGPSVQPNQTNVIDISKSDDEFYNGLRPKWRRNINKAKREGIAVREAKNIEDIKIFYKILTEVTKRGSFKIHPLSYFEDIWNNLSKDSLVQFDLAEKESEALAGYMLLLSSKCAFEIYGGSTLKGRDLEASYLIKFKMMERAKDLGRLFYDQWGVAPKEVKSHPLLNISYFKSGFGGEYHQLLNQYACVYKKIPFLLYKTYKRRSF